MTTTLQDNAVMTFVSFDIIPAQAATPVSFGVPVTVNMTFTCGSPGPNMPAVYVVSFTDAELATITTLAQFRTQVIAKLSAQFHPPLSAAIVTQLTGLIGQTVTV
jgi:hypothetical protein